MKKITTLLVVVLCFFYIPSDAQQPLGDLYDGTYVHDIRITFDQADWMRQLDSNRVNGDEMVIAKVQIDGTIYENVGVSYAKNYTHQIGGKRNPWLLKLNLIDKKQTHQGYKTITVSQALRDPSLVREVLGYEIARRYMPAPRANYVNLTVNSENKGVYVNIEAVDETFIQKNFGGTEGGISTAFRCVPDTRTSIQSNCESTSYGSLRYEKNAKCYLRNFDMLSKEGWDDLIELTRVLNNEPQNVGKMLNVDRTLWFLAFNNVIANLNSYEGQYSGNYYLVRDASGLFNFIPTELNLAFGSYKNTNGQSDLDFEGMVTLDPVLHVNNAAKPLISQLLKNPDNRKIYFSHIRQILNDWFENNAYQTRAATLQTLITAYYINSPEKPYELADFQRSLTETIGKLTKIPGIVELISKRAKYLKKHADLLNIPPQVTSVSYSNRQKYTTKSVGEFHIKAKVDNFPRRVRLMYRPQGSTEAFIELQMFDDGKSHDGEAGDKVFGTVVKPEGKFSAIEYYIIAENAGAVVFDPSNYFLERRKISLAELNK
ncbi:MAG: CotH kinase family protein [Saprospiraceae bacterium]|nr:CotH kinase family protein [Saprospiraceae bacterium]